MAKYRKKPIVVNVVVFEGGNLNKEGTPFEQIFDTGEAFSEFPEWLKKAMSDKKIQVSIPYNWEIGIKTLEGVMTAKHGDYIIKGVNGEIYPCKPDIFEKTYEAVGEDELIIDELRGVPLPEVLKEHINDNLTRYL